LPAQAGATRAVNNKTTTAAVRISPRTHSSAM
jgi:hypothetical protein